MPSMTAHVTEVGAAIALVLLTTLIAAQVMDRARGVALVRQGLLCIPTILAASFVVFAPGNFVRAEQSEYRGDGPLSIAIANLTRIAELVTQHQSARPFLLLWGVAILALVLMVFKLRGWKLGLWSALSCVQLVDSGHNSIAT